ncbi:PREDICTED: small cell adhesion glycoprotein isoform X1 [Condylura cristata]|uniref:small cell adhesion glycoprotein isoform X1 n=1 Tax=Condylura cristata TaxID=143302 RepID=UPI000642FE90|nr:PREDICTED: small cell adhesion glycoprotein isoform X1 [Condylura cristata]
MTILPTTTTPSPGEEVTTNLLLQSTVALSPEAEASTALIAVVITVVFLTLLSVVTLIFFYLYKNKGSYVTYEPAEVRAGGCSRLLLNHLVTAAVENVHSSSSQRSHTTTEGHARRGRGPDECTTALNLSPSSLPPKLYICYFYHN